jgi:hypothetical protein
MVAVLQPPLASVYDPVSSSEGSIDPMGLAGTYDRLADRLLPGVTVRMGRPRFLTAISVGALVCADFELDTLASDGITPPYLVFEWWIVEAFTRAREQLAATEGIPGALKVGACVRNRRPVSAPAYLKTPGVFGFTGIFRRLARSTQLITQDGRLDEAGHRLVDVWSRERGLADMLYGRTGPGPLLRDELRKAVRQGLSDAHTSYRPPAFWSTIAVHLDPAKPGKRERSLLLELIHERSGTPEHVQCISRAIAARKSPLSFVEEAHFLRALRKSAPTSLLPLLTAIDTYESLCRPLSDAFDWARHLATKNPAQGVDAASFVSDAPATKLQKRIAAAIEAVSADPLILECWPERDVVLALWSEVRSPAALFEAVMRHHCDAQARKPPDGKRTWLERDGRGRWLVRAAYRREDAPEPLSDYVHEYRIPTLSRFLDELGAWH